MSAWRLESGRLANVSVDAKVGLNGEAPSGDSGPPTGAARWRGRGFGQHPPVFKDRNGSVPRGDRRRSPIKPVVQAGLDQMNSLVDGHIVTAHV